MIEYAPSNNELITYEEAILYCSFCNHGGYNDWRMPTFDEWIEHRVGVSSNDKLYRWYVTRERELMIHQQLELHKWYIAPVRYI